MLRLKLGRMLRASALSIQPIFTQLCSRFFHERVILKLSNSVIEADLWAEWIMKDVRIIEGNF